MNRKEDNRPGTGSTPAILRLLGTFLVLCLATACVPSGSTGPEQTPAASTPATPDSDTVVLANGLALAPLNAPDTVATMVIAANDLVGLPYLYGGGHRPYDQVPLDSGYDGSGAVSYVLHAAGLLATPMTGEELETFGEPGPGEWVTIVVCGTAHLVIGGMAFDSGADGITSVDATAGPHWRDARDASPSCITRHPDGL